MQVFRQTSLKSLTTKDTKVHKGNRRAELLPDNRGLYRHRSFVFTLFVRARDDRA